MTTADVPFTNNQSEMTYVWLKYSKKYQAALEFIKVQRSLHSEVIYPVTKTGHQRHCISLLFSGHYPSRYRCYMVDNYESLAVSKLVRN